jgi:hypothetical protein
MKDANNKNAFKMGYRRQEFFNYYFWYYEDLLRVMRGFPDVQFRFIVSPSVTLPSDYFAISATREMIEFYLE